MAEIVELQAFEEKRPKSDASNGPGEVLIFPGVRIDRENISLADRLSRPKGSKSKTKAAPVPVEHDD